MRLFYLFPLILLTACRTNVIEPRPVKKSPVATKAIMAKQMLSQKERYQQEKDGVPKGPLPTVFKQVKPVHEPLSQYGNPAAYRVNGHTYDVLTTATGYRTRGLASWYGTKFHRQRTSSGENYDMYALTAAHKTLPLPTYVRIKNLNNGRVAIVKVNDRGPFHADRVVDLSYAAAVALGVFPKGTAPVEIEALTVKNRGNVHVAHYYLQAGAFDSSELANRLQKKLAQLTPSPVFIEKRQRQFLVRVGPFANKNMVDGLKKRLEQHGVRGSFSLLL
jgi:rare lipoprotein A